MASSRWLCLFVLTLALLVAACAPETTVEPAPATMDWSSQVQERIAASGYAPQPVAGGFQVQNRAQGFDAIFTEEGLRVGALAMSLRSWGREGTVRQVERVPVGEGECGSLVNAEGACIHRLAYTRPGIREWWENRPDGLEQGFTLDAPEGAESLVIEIAVEGAVVEDGRAARIGKLRYSGLVAFDETGRDLPAWMEEIEGGLRLVVDDEGAVGKITVDPLLTTASWTAESDQASALFGYSVSSAGDVNGDGYGDVLVGARSYDNVQLEEGRAYLYLGSSSGLASTAAWTAEPNLEDTYFGRSVSSAGDVNGDGFGDVVVGAPIWDNGQTNEGRASVYLGSASGLASTAAWTAESNQDDARFGWSVSAAGDTNGDGYGDVLVGAYGYDNGQADEGRVYLYHGSATGLVATAAWTAESDQPSAQFGWSVSSAGDTNDDGYGDVLVGAPNWSYGQSNEGRAFLYLGSASGMIASWTAESDQASANFGYAVSTAGDVNGDGYGDLVVGAYFYDNGQTAEGRAFLYLGSVTGLVASSWTAESDQAYAAFGYAVSSAGDVNGDGYGDVAVGAYSWDNGQSNEGRAYLYFGSASGLLTTASWTAESDQVGAQFGFSVASAGDVNGDGFGDLVVGADTYGNGEASEGRAFLYLGAATVPATTASWTTEANQDSASFGYSVAAAGDVNGDGFGDVVVGALMYDNGQTDEGGAWLYLGSASGLTTTAAWRAESDLAYSHFGCSVSSAGDVNGDGYGDVVVGANSHSNGQANEGRAYLYLGSTSGLSGAASWSAESNQSGASFGISVAAAGDVNGDGYGDVIVGANAFTDGDMYEGRAFIYLGSASGLATTSSWTAEADQISASFGYWVSSAGDVNGDGYGDVLVGAYGWDNGQTGEGRAWLYVGSASGLATTAAWTAESDQASAAFGNTASSVGDVNGDGYGDIMVGAVSYDSGQTDEGRAYMYLGSASGLASTASWTAEPNQDSAGFATSVSSAGDINGDGYGDVIVGSPQYDNGEAEEGRAWLYLGTTSGLSNTASWTAESDQVDARFGTSVSSAGDVNGDGYGDLLVGANSYDNNQSNEGRAFLYLGNGADRTGPGLALAPQARRPGLTTPISAGLTSPSATGFDVALLSARGPWGRGKVKVQFEAKPIGSAFNGTGLVTQTSWTSTGLYGASIQQALTGLSRVTGYHWRARVLASPAEGRSQGWGHWIYGGLSGNAVGAHVFTGGGTTLYADADGDGYGNPSVSIVSRVSTLTGYVSNAGDCDDTSTALKPGVSEITGDGIDQNCDGQETCHVDADNDGYRLVGTIPSTDADCSDSGEALATEPTGDCNDGAATIHPGATEVIADGIDQDCDGGETCHLDTDDDGYRLTAMIASTDADCTDPGEALSTDAGGDCNDTLATIHPNATEIVDDGIDQDCDGAELCYVDADNDNYRLTGTVTSTDADCLDNGEGRASDPGGDCNDAVAAIHPGATEITADGIDQDCDGSELCYVNADGDNYRVDTTISSPDADCTDSGEALATAPSGDCDDTAATVNPSAPESTGDGIDQNCNSLETCYVDADNDGYRLGTTVTSADPDCADPGEALASDPTGDCNDAVVSIHPAATEIVGDQTDQDCDGSESCYVDADNDGYRLSGTFASADSDCLDNGEAPSTDPTGDCDDGSAAVHPGTTEITGDSVDQDCDGTEVCFLDADNDNYRLGTTISSPDADCMDSGEALASDPTGDCDDAAATVHPSATEITGDGIDQDCDGHETCHVDADDDGYRLGSTVSSTDADCTDPGEALFSDPTGDCDDAVASIHPAAAEIVGDETDQDCDGQESCFVDADDDGYRLEESLPSTDIDCADAGEALASDPAGDCDDANAPIHPAATEACDPADIDENCDGLADDASATGQFTWYLDADGDSYGLTTVTTLACDLPTGYTSTGTDCDDANAAIHPTAAEICDAADADEDCDGTADDADPDLSAASQLTWYPDADGDGYGVASPTLSACDQPQSHASTSTDCDDVRPEVNPGATEVCNGQDDDCDGFTDGSDAVDATDWYLDADMDGYGVDTDTRRECSQPANYAAWGGDCNDVDTTRHPFAPESDCKDPIDYNCDGSTGQADADADGWVACQDCDDQDTIVNPDATETCNAIDDDCDGSVDDNATDATTWYPDIDADGYGDVAGVFLACEAALGTIPPAKSLGNDCDDTNPTVHPGATEVCGGLDDDCDGDVDEAGATGEATWYHDGDQDGFADPKDSETACTPLDAYIPASKAWDCDDADANVNPDETEVCNEIDDNCDGYTDEGLTTPWCADTDGDGFGDARVMTDACSPPDGYVSDATDCDDSDASVYPGSTETPGDGIDQDCDGVDLRLDSGDSGPIVDSGPEVTDTGDGKTGGCAGCASSQEAGGGASILAVGLMGLLVRRRRCLSCTPHSTGSAGCATKKNSAKQVG